MDILPRYIERKVQQCAEHFPIVLLTGARQVGKTTLLRKIFPQLPLITFDPVVDVGNARKEPELFLKQNPAPIILDEVQYAPELLSVIKRLVDARPGSGQYILTGSQNFSFLKNISESLAGRVMVIDLGPMSLSERVGAAEHTEPWWVEEVLRAGMDRPDKAVFSRKTLTDLFDTPAKVLFYGGFPGILHIPTEMTGDFFSSYLRTYVERDVRLLGNFKDQQEFSLFVGLCAALTAKEVNHAQLGREIGVTPHTASAWLSFLKATYLWREVPAYTGNAVKRLSLKPKGYFMDTGLACFLQRISSPEALQVNPLAGALFETHCVMDLYHQINRSSRPPSIYHWRTHGGAEVDLLLERDGMFFPIEIKLTSRPSRSDARGIKAFRATYPHLIQGRGYVLAPIDAPLDISDTVTAIPYDI